MPHSNTYLWAATSSLLCLVLAPVAAQVQEKGVLWETSSQAEIPGMPMKMPPVTGQHCAKKDWSEAPPSGDPSQHCKNTNFNRTPSKLTWSVICEDPPMTGEGELNFNGADSYAGTIQFKTADKSIHVSLTGKKIGTCDNPQ